MAGAKFVDVTAEGLPRIDRYELVAEIASGGMATVFLARLSGVGGFQRFVAIKRLHPHLANEDEFVQMFLDEARLAAGIHHPNVVPILEVGASPRGYYLVMEYVEGDTLARLLARAATAGESVPTNIALRAIVDMLAGLHAAHELNDDQGKPCDLVHRDVSPQNVLVGVDGIARITDFGVAHAASRLGGTKAGQLKGKIAYMAPEQAAGENLDRRADVFAAGIVLWEALAGRRLFKAANEAATISRILNEPITSPAKFNPLLNEELVEVCMHALARDRDKRFATAAQFADALERSTATSLTVRVATSKETADYVTAAIGNEIAQQRDAVRAWLARSEASFRPGSAASSLSVASMSVPGRFEEITVNQGLSGISQASMLTQAQSRTPLIAGGIVALSILGAAVIYAAVRGGETKNVIIAPPVVGQAESDGDSTKEPKEDSSHDEDKAEEKPDGGEKDAGDGEDELDEQPATSRKRRRRPQTRPRSQPPAFIKPAPEPGPAQPGPAQPAPDPGIDLSNPYR